MQIALPDEFVEELVSTVLERLRDQPPRRFVSKAALADHLGIGAPSEDTQGGVAFRREKIRRHLYFDLEEVARFIDVEGTAEDGTISHSVNTIATRERTTRSYTQATQHEFLPCLGEQELMLRQPKARDTAWKRDGRARGIYWRKRAMIRRAGRITPTEEFARRLLVRVLLMRR